LWRAKPSPTGLIYLSLALVPQKDGDNLFSIFPLIPDPIELYKEFLLWKAVQ
jgi:hypothetical protein